MTHQDLQKAIQKAAAKSRIVLFTNRVAKAFVGEVAARTTNSITLKNPRPIEAGFGKGTSDLIGAAMVTITPEMVGKQVAVFVAVEVKVDKDRLRPEQRNFLTVVNSWGGIALEARSVEAVADAVKAFVPPTAQNPKTSPK